MPDHASIRSCKVCGRWLSDANPSKDLCFHHGTPPGKAGADILYERDAHETFVRGRGSKCSSIDNKGKSHVAIAYDGDARNT